MDTLALLCNLHADGPATLQRLRRTGCESLAALRRLDASALALRLDWNERVAERFLREAALLSERVEDELPSAPEAGESASEEVPEFELESTLTAELDDDPEESEVEEGDEESFEDEELEEEEVGFAPPPERVEAVLGAWRELDRIAPPTDPADFEIPRPVPVAVVDRALAEVELAGLDARLRARLAELEVRSLRALVSASELELARALPLGYTRVKHLTFLAARALEALSSSNASRARVLPAQAFEAYAPPPNEPFETAGPFA